MLGLVPSFLDCCIIAAGISLTDTDRDNPLSPCAKTQTGIPWIAQLLPQLSTTEKMKQVLNLPSFHHVSFMAIDLPGHRGLQNYLASYIQLCGSSQQQTPLLVICEKPSYCLDVTLSCIGMKPLMSHSRDWIATVKIMHELQRRVSYCCRNQNIP